MTGAQELAMSAAGLERELSTALTKTASEVSRLEDLDPEQRAEIYSILKAIQMDSMVHEAMIDAMAKLPKRAAGTGA